MRNPKIRNAKKEKYDSSKIRLKNVKTLEN